MQSRIAVDDIVFPSAIIANIILDGIQFKVHSPFEFAVSGIVSIFQSGRLYHVRGGVHTGDLSVGEGVAEMPRHIPWEERSER